MKVNSLTRYSRSLYLHCLPSPITQTSTSYWVILIIIKTCCNFLHIKKIRIKTFIDLSQLCSPVQEKVHVGILYLLSYLISYYLSLFFFNYFWLCWVFVAAQVFLQLWRGGTLQLWYVGFSLPWPLLLQSMVLVALRHVGSSLIRDRTHLPYWEVTPLPLSHKGRPFYSLFNPLQTR